MTPDLICEWLGLLAGSWPPDHYRLLGLEPGESDPEVIEQRVHQRLDLVRHYQMAHPEQATEAMNRLAQAYVCLTDPASKKPYDAALLGGAAPAVAMAAVAETRKAPADNTPDPLAWLFGPAATVPYTSSATPPPLQRLPDLPPPPKPKTLTPAAPEPKELVDPVIAAAQESRRARRGLGTKRALYTRVVATRKLLCLWDRMGIFIEAPKRRLSRSADGPQLTRLLEETVERLRRFPRLLGAAGQPGYLVLALAEQEDPVRSFQTLDAGQREALTRDWLAGRKLLTAHRDFLRQEIRAMRKRTFRQRLLRAASAFLADQPAALFVALLVLALFVALGRGYLWRLLGGHL